jgi:hypothetical protein
MLATVPLKSRDYTPPDQKYAVPALPDRGQRHLTNSIIACLDDSSRGEAVHTFQSRVELPVRDGRRHVAEVTLRTLLEPVARWLLRPAGLLVPRHLAGSFSRRQATAELPNQLCSLRGGSGGFVMKFASFENLLMAATLLMFAVFLTWSVKLITAWT